MTGEGSGAHIVLWPSKRVSEGALIARARSRGVGVYGISHCYLTKPPRTGLILGYSRMNEKDIREGIRLLGESF
jgi:GntR family transcriptional regulator/MocR family aminotransferase